MATEFHDPWRTHPKRRSHVWLDKIWLAPVFVAALVLSGILIVEAVRGPSAPLKLEHLQAAANDQVERRILSAGFGISAKMAARDIVRSMPGTAEQVVANVFERSMAPSIVHYTIERGGTLRIVANLFGIHHHEITNLNPGLSLGSDLAPGTSVVIYERDPRVESHSIGSAAAGQLQGGVPVPHGPGRIIKSKHAKSWATAATIGRLDYILRQWAKRYPDAPPVLVGNLSRRTGGPVQPHRTHQSGRDVDLGYLPVLTQPGEPYHWADMNDKNLDPARTWDLIHLLRETGSLEVLFIDYSIQKLLYDFSVANQLHTPEELEMWLQYPDGEHARNRVIRHAAGHLNHIHARFACRSVEPKCRQKFEPPQPPVKRDSVADNVQEGEGG